MAYVPGWAFRPQEVAEEYKADYKAACENLGFGELYRNRETNSEALFAAINDLCSGLKNGYAEFIVTLDPKRTQGLTERQKVLIADKGNACFGGFVSGNTVTVYTD